MTTLKARFDGHVLIPEQPVFLPQDQVLEIHVEPVKTLSSGKSTLAELADWAEKLPADPNSPTDTAIQHDHYLYGTPKRR